MLTQEQPTLGKNGRYIAESKYSTIGNQQLLEKNYSLLNKSCV